jgi:hypothetical protein
VSEEMLIVMCGLYERIVLRIKDSLNHKMAAKERQEGAKSEHRSEQ